MPKLSAILNKVGKTINLASPNSYQIPRKPPLNTLIFEKLPEPSCGDKITCGIKGPPVTKPVRVCTKEELKTFYCPVPCDCRIKPPPLTFSQKLGLLIRHTIKALFVGGLVYYTYTEGLWSDAFKSSCFLGKFIEKCPKEEDEDDYNEFADLSSFTLEEYEPCAPFIPRSGFVLYRLGYMWNKTIITFFWFVLDAPFELLDALRNMYRKKLQPIPPNPCSR